MYETLVVTALVVSLLFASVSDNPALIFALAAIHGNLALARLALSEMGNRLTVTMSDQSVGGLHGQLTDVDRDLFVRIPTRAILKYLELTNGALSPTYSTINS